MADNEPAETAAWLPVIGRALAYLCLNKAMEREPKKYEDVLAKVDFLRGIGLSEGDASKAAGSSIESVRVLRHLRRKAKNGASKKKTSRRR